MMEKDAPEPAIGITDASRLLSSVTYGGCSYLGKPSTFLALHGRSPFPF